MRRKRDKRVTGQYDEQTGGNWTLCFISKFFLFCSDQSKCFLPPCKSCQKTADTGKKQSTTKKICSSIIGILKNEIGKTKNKTKLDILKGGLGYANDVCDSGGAPDLAKVTKGLPEADKKRILQKSGSALFDGKADIPDKEFGIKSNQSPALSAGGRVADLKNSEPDIKKLSPATEFSLSGTKLSGGAPGQTATKQSSILLASAKTTDSTQKAKAASASADEPCTYSLPTYKSDDCFASYIKAETANVAKNTERQNNWEVTLEKETVECEKTAKGKEQSCPGVIQAKRMIATYTRLVKCGTEFVDKLNALATSCEAEKKRVTKCVHIKERIKKIDGMIAKYTKDKHYKIKDDPTATIYADTSCDNVKGSSTVYYGSFYTLDPEIQQAVIIHENVHAKQCKKYPLIDYHWDIWLKRIRNGWPGLFEIPAYKAEKANLENTATKLKCK